MAGRQDQAPSGTAPPGDVGESSRVYPHSSGDRNTKKSESDWKRFEGGEQRDAPTDVPRGEG